MMMAAAYAIGNTTTRTGPDELRQPVVEPKL